MISTVRINNALLFLLAFAMPFIETWSIGGHIIMNFDQISAALLAYYIFLRICLPGMSPLSAVSSPISVSLILFTGCYPPKKYHNVPFIEYYPFISKETEHGIHKLNMLYQKATFFVLPTKADCFPVVFSEACSYGLPIITSNVGGCLSAIIDDVNGYCLDNRQFARSAVDKIVLLLESPEKYRMLSVNSFDQFKTKLNWKVIGTKAVEMMSNLLTYSGSIPEYETNKV